MECPTSAAASFLYRKRGTDLSCFPIEGAWIDVDKDDCHGSGWYTAGS